MADLNLCACGCGTEVNGTWARGHAKRGRAETRVEPLSDEEIDGASEGWADLGEITIDPEPASVAADPVSVTQDPGGADARPSRQAPPVPDEPPAHARKDRQKAARAQDRPRAIRVTVSVRADITAKIAMPLEIGGQIWRARDPLCGSVFLEQRAAVAEALADIVCDSPDLVAWFTGPMGGFMKYLNLGAALWPVLEMIAAHHVYHSVELAPEDAQEPPQVQYAA